MLGCVKLLHHPGRVYIKQMDERNDIIIFWKIKVLM